MKKMDNDTCRIAIIKAHKDQTNRTSSKNLDAEAVPNGVSGNSMAAAAEKLRAAARHRTLCAATRLPQFTT